MLKRVIETIWCVKFYISSMLKLRFILSINGNAKSFWENNDWNTACSQ